MVCCIQIPLIIIYGEWDARCAKKFRRFDKNGENVGEFFVNEFIMYSSKWGKVLVSMLELIWNFLWNCVRRHFRRIIIDSLYGNFHENEKFVDPN